MSSRKTQFFTVLGGFALLTLIGVPAAVSQDSGSQEAGIEIHNGPLQMHGNNITDAGFASEVDVWDGNIQMHGNKISNSSEVKTDIVNTSQLRAPPGDGIEIVVSMISSDPYRRFGAIDVATNVGGDKGGKALRIEAKNDIELYPDSDNNDGTTYCAALDNGNLECSGSKNWIQSLNSTHEAVYSSQESPEVRAVYEGNTTVKDGVANVSLPTHFSETVSDDRPGLRVQATPHELATVAVTERTDSYVVIEASNDVDVDFRVTGIREGYEDKQVVRKKDSGQEGGN